MENGGKICPFFSKWIESEKIDRYDSKYREVNFWEKECLKERCMAWGNILVKTKEADYYGEGCKLIDKVR